MVWGTQQSTNVNYLIGFIYYSHDIAWRSHTPIELNQQKSYEYIDQNKSHSYAKIIIYFYIDWLIYIIRTLRSSVFIREQTRTHIQNTPKYSRLEFRVYRIRFHRIVVVRVWSIFLTLVLISVANRSRQVVRKLYCRSKLWYISLCKDGTLILRFLPKLRTKYKIQNTKWKYEIIY